MSEESKKKGAQAKRLKKSATATAYCFVRKGMDGDWMDLATMSWTREGSRALREFDEQLLSKPWRKRNPVKYLAELRVTFVGRAKPENREEESIADKS